MIHHLLLLALLAAAPAQDVATTPADVLAGLSFREVGPYRGGRSCAVTGIRGDELTYYMGACGGGVWKTTDAGDSWRNVSGDAFGWSIGAVAVAPSDPSVVYVGGGEKTVRGNVSHGDGVWRSDDGGESWRHLGLDESRHVPRVRVHPDDPDTAWVAALGSLYGPNEERGVYKTTDGGETWRQVLFVNPDAGCVDLVLDPNHPRVLYASFWRVRRTPWSLSSGGEGSGMWKSTDGGESWTEITRNPGLPGGTVGISGVSVSRADSRNVYAIVEAEEGGVFRSRDAGATWRRVNDDRSLRQRAWYYSRIYADPVDTERVYVLNVGFHRSDDGGRTFTRLSTPHSDNHDLWIDPDDPQRMIEANDGGANVSFDGGETWSEQSNQPTAQMYRVSVDTDFPYRLLGGQQDNSAIRIRSRSLQSGSIGERDWEPSAGGESGHLAAHPDDPDVVFGGSYGGYLVMVDHDTGERRNVNVWPDNPMGAGAEGMRYRFQWNFPIFFSPHPAPDGGERALYAASNVLFRSTDRGASWEAISPDLTRNDPSKLGPSGGPITKDNTGVEYYCTIFAAFESPAERGVIWCGSDDGLVHVSRDDGATWTEVTPRDLPPWTQVNDLIADPHRPGGAYLVGTRYKLDDFRPYLFRTEDYGASWTRIDDGIDAEHYTRAIEADPERQGLLFAGTERGLYVSTDDGASWSSFQLDLPLVPITDLEIHRGDLVVATQGRGYWILDDLGPLRQLDLEAHAGRTVLYEPAPTYRAGRRGRRNPRDAGTNPPYGVTVSFRLGDDVGADTNLALSFVAPDGEVVRRFTPPGQEERAPYSPVNDGTLPRDPGFHRFTWDLRHPGAESFDDAVLWAANLGGPLAVPGTYTVRLEIDDAVVEVPAEVRIDPRSSATVADLEAQLAFLEETGATLTRAHRAIRDLRTARGDLDTLAARLGEGEDADALRAEIDAARESLTAVEEALYQTKNRSRQDPLNYPIRLTDKLGGARGAAMTGDFAPTAQQRAVAAELTAAIEEELATLDGLFAEDLPAIDARARELAVPFVRVPDR